MEKMPVMHQKHMQDLHGSGLWKNAEEKMNLEEWETKAQSLDVGDAKKTRILAFIRKSYRLGLENEIDLETLHKSSRGEITRVTKSLGKT